MASEIIRDQKIWFDGYDLTGFLNAVSMQYAAEALDETVIGDSARKFKGGLKTVSCGIEGLFDETPDGVLATVIGTQDKILTIGRSGSEGDPVFSFKSMAGQYSPRGAVGELFGFSLQAAATGKLVRGTLMENNSAAGATADGTARQLGAVSASQRLYAGLHVLNSDGSGDQTLDVTIESDATNDFSGSETTRVTFSQVTDSVGGQWQELGGAVTDEWWRVSWAITGGGTPAFDFIAWLAIL